MMKLILTVLFAALFPYELWAADVSLAQARQRAKLFADSLKAADGRPLELADSAYTAKDAAFYIFNMKRHRGFVVVAGDDRVPAILGYATEGYIDYADLPCSVRSIFEDYQQQVQQLRLKGSDIATIGSGVGDVEVPLLMTSKWGQNAPFNSQCRLLSELAPTGCVATAMAQLLYYHRQRLADHLHVGIPGYTCRTFWTQEGQTGRQRLRVEEIPAGTPIDWAGMTDVYDEHSTKRQRDAVAALMHYCGAAVEMEYRQSGSAANVWSLPVAVKKYFGFSPRCVVKDHALMSDGEWAAMLGDELKAGRPVVLSGETMCGSGHVFLCDGRDAEGRFHLNWGWTGVGNGYYVLLPFVSPQADGPARFTGQLQAVVGLEPGDGSPYQERQCLTTMEFELGGVVEGRFLPAKNILEFKRKDMRQQARFGYRLVLRNLTASTRAFESALALYDKKGRMVEVLEKSVDDYKNFNKIQTKIAAHTFDYGASIRKGLYRLCPVSRVAGTTEWLLNDDLAEGRYIEVNIKKKLVTFRMVKPDPANQKGNRKKKK